MEELKQTVELMVSDDYKDRFLAEYNQLGIRLLKLMEMVFKWDNNELDFVPTCPRAIYTYQIEAMKKYFDFLVIRAKIEGIELKDENIANIEKSYKLTITWNLTTSKNSVHLQPNVGV